MLPERREAEIVHALRRIGPTTVTDLTELLGVSASTVRRDLDRMDTKGILQRVRGGARVTDDADSARPFGMVAGQDTADKLAVAQRAADLIADGQVLLLDIGTTVAALAEQLRGRRLTVITSNLAVLDILRDDPGIELVLLGGVVRHAYRSTVGLLTESALAQVRADIAFLGTSGVLENGEVLDTTQIEVPVKRSLISAANRTALVADRHKFPGTGALKICNLADLNTLVTNTGIPETLRRYCHQSGLQVVTP
jgi:DeoR/GlpR family transcriptional regulator of sugar metabolism